MPNKEYEKQMIIFIKRLESLRKLYKIKLMNFTEMMGVHKITYFRIRKGESPPTIKFLLKASRFFHKSTDHLLGLEEDEGFAVRMLERLSKKYDIPMSEILEALFEPEEPP
jgi:transcriptional regulator with XRE-family HTH domain